MTSTPKQKVCPHPEKLRFRSEHAAWLKALDLFRERKFENGPYKCKCGLWHLTGVPRPIPEWLEATIKYLEAKGLF